MTLLTGHEPQMRLGEPEGLEVPAGACSPQLRNILRKLVATEPASRFQSAVEASAALEAPPAGWLGSRLPGVSAKTLALAAGSFLLTAAVFLFGLNAPIGRWHWDPLSIAMRCAPLAGCLWFSLLLYASATRHQQASRRRFIMPLVYLLGFATLASMIFVIGPVVLLAQLGPLDDP